jgi:hypothetical protein
MLHRGAYTMSYCHSNHLGLVVSRRMLYIVEFDKLRSCAAEPDDM